MVVVLIGQLRHHLDRRHVDDWHWHLDDQHLDNGDLVVRDLVFGFLVDIRGLVVDRQHKLDSHLVKHLDQQHMDQLMADGQQQLDQLVADGQQHLDQLVGALLGG